MIEFLFWLRDLGVVVVSVILGVSGAAAIAACGIFVGYWWHGRRVTRAVSRFYTKHILGEKAIP